MFSERRYQPDNEQTAREGMTCLEVVENRQFPFRAGKEEKWLKDHRDEQRAELTQELNHHFFKC